MHKEIQVDIDYPFVWRFYSDGIQQVPTAATVTIENNGGTDIITDAAATIDAEGTITYTFLAADNDTVAENFKATVKYTLGGVDKYFRELFDSTYTPLINNVRDEDLFTYVGELRTKTFEDIFETSAAGSTTTLKSSDLEADRRDWTGGFTEIYISDTVVHSALISSYVMATGIITFTPAYGSAIAADLKFRLRSSYQKAIDEAFNETVMQDVRGRVGIAAKYIDVNVMRLMTIFKALEIICIGKVESEDDKWAIRRDGFAERYKGQYSKMSNSPTDDSEDGNMSPTEDDEKTSYCSRDIRR